MTISGFSERFHPSHCNAKACCRHGRHGLCRSSFSRASRWTQTAGTDIASPQVQKIRIIAYMGVLGIVFCQPLPALAHHTCGEAVRAYNAYVKTLTKIRTIIAEASSPTTVNNPNIVSDAQDKLQQTRMQCTKSALRYDQAYTRLPKGFSLRDSLPQSADMTACMLNYAGFLSHILPRYSGRCPADAAWLKGPQRMQISGWLFNKTVLPTSSTQ
jgi:hypothetical protein